MSHDLHIQPLPGANGAVWRDLALAQPQRALFEHPQSAWRDKTRCELGLATDRPIIATGHQTLLWHPGILAKYLIVDRLAARHDLATANLVVDQHVGPFSRFDVPICRADGSIQERTIDLVPHGDTLARQDIPMGLQSAFSPADPPLHLPFALDSVRDGVQRIFGAVKSSSNAPDAAIQMARALNELMLRWARPMPHVTASDLGETSLARRMMEAMADDPRAMAEAYNHAVRSVPEAGIPPLLMHHLYVEAPLWRIRPDGRRMRAYDNDLETAMDASARDEPFTLLPRALFMTALVRLGMCDLFVHGTGAATYDRAMELWIRNWLGVNVAPIGVATANVRLPIELDEPVDVREAMHAHRRAWHDPAREANQSISEAKRRHVQHIGRLPRRSPERRAAFYRMHEELDQLRQPHHEQIDLARRRHEQAIRREADQHIAARRDWTFPLYPKRAIDDLASLVESRIERAPLAGRG